MEAAPCDAASDDAELACVLSVAAELADADEAELLSAAELADALDAELADAELADDDCDPPQPTRAIAATKAATATNASAFLVPMILPFN